MKTLFSLMSKKIIEGKLYFLLCQKKTLKENFIFPYVKNNH
jgi:hypothetical protein